MVEHLPLHHFKMSPLHLFTTSPLHHMLTIISIIFILGYLAIALEHPLKVNKGATALLLAVVCWMTYSLYTPDSQTVNDQLQHNLSNIAEIIFFLIGAMTIVELIATHNGFSIITQKITTTSKRKLLWIVSFITFFLSSVLNNLTTAIVMVTLVQKMIPDRNDRLLFSSMIIIASNAGGAWTPIGDVTTTMLWIGNQISSVNIMKELFLPAVLSLVIPLLYQSRLISGTFDRPNQDTPEQIATGGQLILILGVIGLLSAPIFKNITHLPPYMGMLGSLGILWVVTELLHHGKKDHTHLSIYNALTRIDTPSVLFFLGILLAVGCLESVGQLTALATWLDTTIGNKEIIVTLLGLLSAIVDNVPLTAAVQGMYSLDLYPTDHKIWEMLAYAVGTGGSILIIGSAAGVVVMGMENISFGWYMRKIAFTALLGYLAGIATYLAIFALLGH